MKILHCVTSFIGLKMLLSEAQESMLSMGAYVKSLMWIRGCWLLVRLDNASLFSAPVTEQNTVRVCIAWKHVSTSPWTPWNLVQGMLTHMVYSLISQQYPQ